MANKRFTFADAKLKIKELEGQVDDLQGILSDEFANAKEDIVEDVSNFGYGDVIIAIVAATIGFAIGYFVKACPMMEMAM